MHTAYTFKEISIWESDVSLKGGTWQADCDDCHARGETPGQAADKLVMFMIAKQNSPRESA